MHKVIITIFIALFTTCSLAQNLEIEKKDYLKLIVSSYVNGFNEFDTSITTYDDSVSVGIYYDSSTQSNARADQLAERFRAQIQRMIQAYEWAEDVTVSVNVYSESRESRGY